MAGTSSRYQWSQVAETVANAHTAKRIVGDRAALEVVVQGATTAQRQRCATQLAALRPQVYGIPLSGESRRRAYADAATKVIEIRHVIPKNAVIHAIGVGSRTLMAVLGALKVTFFDSSSAYEGAVHSDAVPAVTMCHFARPLGKAMCTQCQAASSDLNPPNDPIERRVHHNLVEIRKEILRVRCAKSEGVVEEYLSRRLTPGVAKEVGPIVAQFIKRQ